MQLAQRNETKVSSIAPEIVVEVHAHSEHAARGQLLQPVRPSGQWVAVREIRCLRAHVGSIEADQLQGSTRCSGDCNSVIPDTMVELIATASTGTRWCMTNKWHKTRSHHITAHHGTSRHGSERQFTVNKMAVGINTV